MKLEIELDLNKIDYDSINQQILDKLSNMDIAEVYQINQVVGSAIRGRVDEIINDYFRNGYGWGNLSSNARTDMNEVIKANIEETVKPMIQEAFSKFTPGELEGIIYHLIPNVMVNMLTNGMRDFIQNSFYGHDAQLLEQAHNLIEDRLRRNY
jgi:hypothetical protein